ncbi:hypothetical protein G6O67_006948 [Ophiocordyceps sinensis]|uniref:Uncharacterized protein n=2 Tax=Ophiocordyceps sinensis TaxID=72228 RepID=A0A8H4LT38_9HYPO|nr:hypothetical protein OCS_05862 [Ophiocordyceps sinensis CO18]KAF4504943.1 hypothetical protein G6O67_006948 [Ophiocordyceps sinensis]
MPIRNPFARRPGPGSVVIVRDENVPPERDSRNLGFERVDTVGSKASSVLSIRSAKGQDTGEYKMSVVNDSGVYLPPSPIEERAPWPRKYLSRASSDTASSFGDIEHFSISRESFDSYRRSFDITARSPVIGNEPLTRQSLDSARLYRAPRSVADRRVDHQPPTPEECFEDIGLDDNKQQQPRKRGFFSKFGEQPDRDSTGQAGVSRFLMHGRKRGQSGQGSELGQIERPRASVEARP